MTIDVLPSSRRTEGIGFYGISNNISTALAPSVGLGIYQWTGNFDILFWIAIIISFLGLCADASIEVRDRQLIQDKKVLSLDRFFLTKGWAIFINTSIFGLCFGVITNYLAIYSKEEMGMTGGTGIFFLLFALGLIAARLSSVRSFRQGRIVPNATYGVIFASLGYLLFVACPNAVGYYGAPLLIGWGNGHFWPSFQNMIINIANKNERGTANSTLLTAWDLGLGIGILMGVAAIHIAGALFFLVTRRDYQNRMRSRID
jgi:predicted MFS family arabinose efflux permease